jgi:hypothetical protein
MPADLGFRKVSGSRRRAAMTKDPGARTAEDRAQASAQAGH